MFLLNHLILLQKLLHLRTVNQRKEQSKDLSLQMKLKRLKYLKLTINHYRNIYLKSSNFLNLTLPILFNLLFLELILTSFKQFLIKMLIIFIAKYHNKKKFQIICWFINTRPKVNEFRLHTSNKQLRMNHTTPKGLSSTKNKEASVLLNHGIIWNKKML